MRTSPFLLLALVAIACKPAPSAEADAAAGPLAALVAGRDAGPASSVISEASAKEVLTAWLAAQNSGSFAAYEALYAPRFEGVRRSGNQTARLDRRRWMTEREAMFKQKTTVTAKDVTIALSHDGAAVTFVQTWISDAYRDEGPKRIVLTRADGKLKIAREEMLRSSVLAPGTLPQEKFAFAVHVPGPHLVIRTAPKDEWAKNAPKTVSLGEPVVTRRDAAKLPPELAAWVGKKVELFGTSGSICEGTVSGLSIVGRVIPHFGMRAQWTATGDHQGEPRPSPVEIADEAWALSSGSGESGRLLVGEVHADKGDCAGALWGRAVAADKPVLVDAKPADPATKALALAELRKTRAYAETQARYVSEKEPKDPPRWEDFDSNVKALVFAHPTGGTIVTVSIRSGTGCGTFGGTLSAAWEQKGAALALLKEPSDQELVPASAGDVDGDGKLELVFPEGLLRAKGGKLDVPIRLGIPNLDCGC
jgi:hypothetical protein